MHRQSVGVGGSQSIQFELWLAFLSALKRGEDGFFVWFCFDLFLTHFTYSADFQKCPGWERRRFRFGNFSSRSTSLEKLGLSSCLKAQQKSRISWESKGENSTNNWSVWRRWNQEFRQDEIRVVTKTCVTSELKSTFAELSQWDGFVFRKFTWTEWVLEI